MENYFTTFTPLTQCKHCEAVVPDTDYPDHLQSHIESSILENIVMPFGKYKGHKVKTLSSNYMNWFIKTVHDKPYITQAMQFILRKKTPR